MMVLLLFHSFAEFKMRVSEDGKTFPFARDRILYYSEASETNLINA